MIIDNAFSALSSEGELFILDYNEFSLLEMPWYIRLPFRMMECPYAFDFISRDWKRIMRRGGFGRFDEHVFFGGYVRLLKAVKLRGLLKSGPEHSKGESVGELTVSPAQGLSVIW